MTAVAVTPRALAQYGALALPVAFAGFPLYVLAPDFYATQHGVSLAVLGVVLLVIRLVDAVQDPLIGWCIDRLRGHAFLITAVAGFILWLAVAGLFNVVYLSPVVWFATSMILAVTAYSVMSVMLGAYAIRWTIDRDQQTRLAAAREGFGLLGLLVAVSAPGVLSHYVPLSDVYLWYAVLLAALLMLGLGAFSRILPQGSGPEVSGVLGHETPWRVLAAVPGETKKLLGLYALSMLASSLPAVLVIFYVRDLLGAGGLTGAFLFAYFLCGALGMPLWGWLSRRRGKAMAWVAANILAVGGFIFAFFLAAGDVWPFLVVCMVSGLALGADLTLPPSIMADQAHQHGTSRHAGAHYALLVFVAKLSLAVASVLALPLLEQAGFVAGAENTAAALGTLAILYALVPSLLKLLAAGGLYLLFIRPAKGIVQS